MERPIFFIVLIMLSHLTAIFATINESHLNRSSYKIEKTNKKLTFKNNQTEYIPARNVSNASGSTADTEIDDVATESDVTTQSVKDAENIEAKSDAVQNKIMSSDNNGLLKKDHKESLYQPIYSLGNLDYFLRHPEKKSPNLNPIHSDLLPNNIYDTDDTLQSNIAEFLRNFRPLKRFYPKFPYSIKILDPILKRPQNSIFTPERLKKDHIFLESKLQKVIQDFLKNPSALLDTPFVPNPSELIRISSQDDTPEWNFLNRNQLQHLSNNVNHKNAPLADRSQDKHYHKVFNIKQPSFLSSRGSPRELLEAIDDFFNNISLPFDPKILKSFTTLIERLLNTHPFEHFPSLQVRHSIYSSLLQEQPLAPNSSPTPEEDDSLLQGGDNFFFENLYDILQSLMDNNSIYPENSENLKDDDLVRKDLVSSDNTSALAEQHQFIKVPLLKLTTPSSKDIPQQSENLQYNDNVSSLVDSLAVFVNNSFNESIPTFGNLSMLGNNSQTEGGKPIDFSSYLENIHSDLTNTLEFFSNVPSQPGTSTSGNKVTLDKSLLSSQDTLSPSKGTIVELTKNNNKKSSYTLISEHTVLFNETQSPGNFTFLDNTRSIIPPESNSSEIFSIFKSVPIAEGSQNKSLDTTVYLYMPPSLSTGINKHNKKPKVPMDKNIPNEQNVGNALDKVAQVGNMKKKKNPDCLKGSTWISKCHQCTCSDDGFSDCDFIQDCVLPPREKPMLCKPFTTFEMGECNSCVCSGDGVPICKLTDCYLHGHDKTEESIQITIPSENTKEIKEKSKHNDYLNDVLRSNDSDYNSDDKNNTNSDDRMSKLTLDDEDFDGGTEYGHRRVENRRSHVSVSNDLKRCGVGSVWEINCFNCFCGLNGRPSCDKITHCSLLPYGKPPRCKPTTVFENRCGGTCKCDDEGEVWCEEC